MGCTNRWLGKVAARGAAPLKGLEPGTRAIGPLGLVNDLDRLVVYSVLARMHETTNVFT